MKKLFFLTILFFLGACFFPFLSQALTISPAKIYLSADPGETITTKMTVKNDLSQVTTFYPVFEKYTTTGGDNPVFTADSSGLPTWITTTPSKVTLKENEAASIVITIRVPEGAEPGGHYAAIFWSSAPPEGEEKGQVGIVTRVGALVMLEVSGDVVESGEITEFKALNKVYRSRPVGFSYKLEVTGNVHLRPQGEVLIKNFFGKTIEILNANPGGLHVLPGTLRNIDTANWEAKAEETDGKVSKYETEGGGFIDGLKKELNGFALGYYRADLYLEYGVKNIQIAKASYGFWVLPWRILLIGIILLALILLIAIKGIRIYNRWLIAQATKRIRRK